jgi:hypothetical protein
MRLVISLFRCLLLLDEAIARGRTASSQVGRSSRFENSEFLIPHKMAGGQTFICKLQLSRVFVSSGDVTSDTISGVQKK